MISDISEIEESIQRMTAVVRQGQAREVAMSFGEDPEAEVRPLGWWVLACGDELNKDSLETRDSARERLLHDVRMAGLVLPENIWVWDEEGRAQLVIATVPTLERAERLAVHLKGKGLVLRIKREEI